MPFKLQSLFKYAPGIQEINSRVQLIAILGRIELLHRNPFYRQIGASMMVA
jgi:hypothetical protein